MKKLNIFYKAIALVVVLASVISVFTACGEKKPMDQNQPPVEEQKELLDISGYAIVRYSNAKQNVTKKATGLKNAIEETLGLDLKVGEDWYNPNTPPDLNAKEILIDKTNRKESSDALAKLESKEGDAYIIDITENKIVIVGKTDISTARGISYFINNYVMVSPKGNGLDVEHGKSVIQAYSAVKNISIAGKLDMDVEIMSSALRTTTKYTSVLGYTSRIDGVYFPAVIELQHQPNEDDNGTLIASTSIGETPKGGKIVPTLGVILESRNEGKSWSVIARPQETISPSTGWAGNMAHIYELPAQLGDLPAGTLIYSSNSVNYDRSSHIGVWKSNDCGKTWEEISIVASAGGLSEGVWEPVMFYDNGYLYCFYSDDSDPKHDQKIVYKRSKDGIHWGKLVEVCAFDNPADRPGMPVITKMGNGEYFLVYEYCGSLLGNTPDCFVYYKTTKDMNNWNPSDPGTRITAKYKGQDYITASSPCCVWTPAGGPNGTLFVQGRREFGFYGINPMFVSFDYGKTWDTIEPPMPYDWYSSAAEGVDAGIGYRPIMVLGADPSVIHYISIINMEDATKTQLKYARLKIYD